MGSRDPGGYTADNSNDAQAYTRGNHGTGTGWRFQCIWFLDRSKGSQQAATISSMSGSSYFGGGATSSITASAWYMLDNQVQLMVQMQMVVHFKTQQNCFYNGTGYGGISLL